MCEAYTHCQQANEPPEDENNRFHFSDKYEIMVEFMNYEVRNEIRQ
jgi:hypothetical protein